MKNSTLRRSFIRILTVFVFLVSLAPAGSGNAAVLAAPPAGSDSPTKLVKASLAPAAVTNWCIAGEFQGWNENTTRLYDDGTHGDLFARDGIYSLDLPIATAGSYDYKTVECGNWSTSYPPSNTLVITTAANQIVKFTFDANDHTTDAGTPMLPAKNIVYAWTTLPASFTVVGDFQGWVNDKLETRMTDRGHGLYTLNFTVASAGSHETKIVVTGSWNYFGNDSFSKADHAGITFNTIVPNQEMIFLLDIRTGRVAVVPQATGAGTWCVAGQMNGWNASANPRFDDGTHGDLVGGDGIFSTDLVVATPDRYEWKVLNNCSWGSTLPNSNSWLNTATDNQIVKITFDTNNHASDAGMQFVPTQNIVNAWDTQPASLTAVGGFQGWNNNTAASAMTNLGNGLVFLSTPDNGAGAQEMKIVQTGIWDAFGTDNRSINAQNINYSVTNSGETWGFLMILSTSPATPLPNSGTPRTIR